MESLGQRAVYRLNPAGKNIGVGSGCTRLQRMSKVRSRQELDRQPGSVSLYMFGKALDWF